MKIKIITLLLLLSFQLLHLNAENLKPALLEASDKRQVDSALFNRALAGNDIQMQKEAILALGRIGDVQNTLKITPFLHSRQPEVRAHAAFALGINGDVKAHQMLALRLKTESHAEVIVRILNAIGNLGDEKEAISTLLPYLDNADDDIVSAACDGLTLAWTFHRDKVSIPNSTQVFRLLELSEKNDQIAEHCLYTASRLRRDAAMFNPEQVLALAPKLTSLKSKILLMRIMGALDNQAFESEIIKSLSDDTAIALKAEATSAYARLTNGRSIKQLEKLSQNKNAQIRINLVNSLILDKSNPQEIALVEAMLNDTSSWVRSGAVRSLFIVKGSEMQPLFLELLNSEKFYEQQLALQIIQTYELENEPELIKVLIASKYQGIVNSARALQTGNDESEDNSPAKATIPAVNALAMASKRLVMETNKGNVTIQLLASTPYTSANFYELAKSGYYNGLSFHRVIPNFVAQGGDPDGTGSGGPGYSIREELYPVSHERGTVGMATAGKDTGGSQFFFNTNDNLHLNNNYTVFGRIIAGLEVIDQLAIGDTIIKIREQN